MGEFGENEMFLISEFPNSVNSSSNKSGDDKSPDLASNSYVINPIETELVAALPTPPPPPPSLSPLPRKKRGRSSGNQKSTSVAGSNDDHKLHIWTERERRKKMRDMFSNLHALLPQLNHKADKSTIVNEAVSSIKRLEQTLEHLIQRQKLERIHGIGGSGGVRYDIDHLQQETRESFMADYVCNYNNIGIGSNNNNNNIDYNVYPLPPPPPPPPGFWTWTWSNVVLNVVGEEAQYSIYAMKKQPGLFSAICYILDNHKLLVLTCNILTHHGCSVYNIHAQKGTTPPDNDQLPQGFPVLEEIYKQVALEINFLTS